MLGTAHEPRVAPASRRRRRLFGPLEDAGHAVIFEQLGPIGGTGGVIAVDADGAFAMPFNTPGMYRAYQFSDGISDVFIGSEDHPREAATRRSSEWSHRRRTIPQGSL